MIYIKRLQYIKPSWYFQLKSGAPVFPEPEILPEDIKDRIKYDKNYKTKYGYNADIAFQAFHLGYIVTENLKSMDVWKDITLPAEDEYRFIRRFYKSFWSTYILILQILSFNDPIKELRAWWISRKIKQIQIKGQEFFLEKYLSYAGNFVKEQPLVSVIIPTLNRYRYLKDVFNDLEKQTYTNFEVIVVDQSEPFDEEIYKNWKFDLKYWFQSEKALWKARNDAIKASKGDFILLYDDDSLVEEDWIEQHLKALDFFNADLSSGVSLSTIGSKVPEHYTYFRWSDQLDTGNVMVKREVFEKAGLFDRQFEKQRMGDGEFGLRAYLAGYKNVSNPLAKRIHLKVGSGGLRQMGSWDAFRPKSLFAPRPIPSVLYLHRKYFGRRATILMLLKTIPSSIIPYKYKGNKFLLIVGSFFSFLILPIVLIQISRSWSLASKKLKKGAIIDRL